MNFWGGAFEEDFFARLVARLNADEGACAEIHGAPLLLSRPPLTASVQFLRRAAAGIRSSVTRGSAARADAQSAAPAPAGSLPS